VRVPEPFAFVENVLVMELVRDRSGQPAKRLADLKPSASEARLIHEQLLAATVKMLCAGVVHGDLSEFNVLIGVDGPVIIDFPQAIDPAKNRNARKILLRDIGNLDRFLARHTRRHQRSHFGSEMWDLYEKQLLSPETQLKGVAPKGGRDEGDSILAEMEALDRAARARRESLGLPPPRARAPIIARSDSKPNLSSTTPTPGRTRRRKRVRQSQPACGCKYGDHATRAIGAAKSIPSETLTSDKRACARSREAGGRGAGAPGKASSQKASSGWSQFRRGRFSEIGHWYAPSIQQVDGRFAALTVSIVRPSLKSNLGPWNFPGAPMKNRDAEVLRDRGINPSAQRVAIAQYVLHTQDHPNAEEVWTRVKKRFPQISRATVYNTLNLFVEQGLLKQLILAEGCLLFDPNLKDHHHFIDDESGEICDIPWEAVSVSNVAKLKGFSVTDYQVVMRGKRTQRSK